MTTKKALITGITGQDGSYLTELLLAKGYEVHGIIRRASTFNTGRIDALYQDPHINGVKLFLHYGDLSDSTNLIKLLYRLQPDEIYHLAAQSHESSRKAPGGERWRASHGPCRDQRPQNDLVNTACGNPYHKPFPAADCQAIS